MMEMEMETEARPLRRRRGRPYVPNPVKWTSVMTLVPTEHATRLSELAAAWHTSRSDLIREAIRTWLASVENGQRK